MSKPRQRSQNLQHRPPHRGPTLAILLTGLLTSLGLILASSQVSHAASGNLIGVPTEVKTATLAQQTVAFGGAVVPYREATLAAQMPGRIEFLAGEEGDSYKAGELLAQLDDDELLAQRNQATAELANSAAALRNAGVQYNRELYSPYSINRSPGGMGLPTLMDQMFTRPFSNVLGTSNNGLDRHAALVQQGTQIEQARNTMAAAQAQIQQIDAKLRDTRTYAPFDGVIVKKHVEVGDTVQPGTPLYKFADLRYLQIKVDVPERFAVQLHKGQLLKGRLDVLNQAIDIRVAQIFPVADELRHTVTVKFDLKTTTAARSGMYAKVLLPDPQQTTQNELVIPSSAIDTSGALPRVYVIHKDRYQLRLIRVGESLPDGTTRILSGLQAGDWVLDQARPASTGPARSDTDQWGRQAQPNEYEFTPG